MMRLSFLLLLIGVGLGTVAYLALPMLGSPGHSRELLNLTGSAERGAYVMRTAGCIACHTDSKNKGKPLAGGREMKTPFGTFITPNITPDLQTGIGSWTTAQFIEALAQGANPQDAPYYPAFPYTSYAKMTTQDLVDLKAYLDTVEPVQNQVRAHDLAFPFNLRNGLIFWKWLYFDPSPASQNKEKSAAWNRGAYLVEGPGHCAECHTPRDAFGGLNKGKHFRGTPKSFDGEKIPDLHQNLDKWSVSDMTFLLQMGMKPDGDFVSGSMGEVVRDGTAFLSAQDIQAIATYLLDLPK